VLPRGCHGEKCCGVSVMDPPCRELHGGLTYLTDMTCGQLICRRAHCVLPSRATISCLF
jgi:hypothetical protein